MGLMVELEKGASAAPVPRSMSPNGIHARGTFNGARAFLGSGVSRQFTTWLKSLIDGKFPNSYRSFIRAAESGRDEDSGVAYLSKVLAGKKPPPLDRVAAWAEALGLTAEDRALFIVLAHLAHGPEIIEAEYLRLRREVDDLRRLVHEGEKREPAPRRPRKRTQS